MLQEMLDQVQEVYSHLEGVQAAAFSFWMFCVACFCAAGGYIVYLGIAHVFRMIFPKRISGLNPKNRF